MNEISNSLTETIKKSDLKDMSVDIVEVFTDEFLEEGIIKELPIIKTIFSIYKTGISIKDKLFIKKILYFLNELKSVEINKRTELINKIDSSEAYKTKVGEKLLLILDRVDEYEKAEIIGKLFKGFLNEKIDYDSFVRCSKIVESVVPEDLIWFVQSNVSNYELVDISDYISWGVLEFKPFQLEIIQRQNYDYREDQEKGYELSDAKIECELSFIGKKLREVLKSDYA
jgi:hypothetical protein